MMKTILAGIKLAGFGVVAALLLAAPSQAQDTAAKSRLFDIQKKGVLRVGMTGDYFPMTFREVGSNEFQGHQVDAAKELAKDLGVKVEFVPTDWKTIITGLQSDKYDIAMSAFYTSQGMKVRGNWSNHSAKRVRDAASLSGRDRLVEALRALGFGLR